MRVKLRRRATTGHNAALLAALSLFLASCTSATDPSLDMGMPGFSAPAANMTASTDEVVVNDASPPAAAPAASLPDQVAFVPATSPKVSEFPVAPDGVAVQPQAPDEVAAAAEGSRGADKVDAAAADPAKSAQPAEPALPVETAAVASAAAPPDKPVDDSANAAEPATPSDYPVYVTATDPTQPIAPKKKSFLSSFFGSTPAKAAPARNLEPKPAETKVASLAATPPKAKAIIELGDQEAADEKPVRASFSGSDNALPGVRQSALFEIKRKSGIDDDSDVDVHEDEDLGPIQVASAGGLARLSPNGLLRQTESVDVACLKPSLVRVLKQIEAHYGKKIMVTSGYRSPARNRRARGAKNSLHMYCAAADIQIPGVSKWELASYARAMTGRGGVGTYCHTNSIHVDVGPERDWNWRCRRRR